MSLETAVHGEIEPMFRHLSRGTLGYVGYDVLEPFWAFHVPYVSDRARQNELDRLRAHIARLDSLPILSVPDLTPAMPDVEFCPRPTIQGL
jgi:NAD(P)H dehydrogenase (quinone)